MKIKNLKFFLSASILVCFTSIFLLSCVGCGGIKQSDNSINEKESKDIKNAVVGEKQENESLPNDKQSVSNNLSQKIPSFKKIVNGEEVIVSLTGNYHKTLKFPNKEYPLEVKEVYPGIVTYDKYDSIKIIPYHQEDSIRIFNRVVDEIEFYENGKFLSSYDVDQNNPYLKGRDGIKIMNHYSDAEGTEVLIDRTEYKKYTIDTYHLNQNVTSHGSCTSINYWKHEISNGLIVSTPNTLIILDSLGNMIFNQDYEKSMDVPVIDSEGKYLMCAFAGVETVDQSGFKFQEDGFEIWQITPKEIMHVEVNENSDMWVDGSTIDESLLICTYSFPNSKIKSTALYMFDVSSTAFIYKEFDTKAWTEISMNWFKTYKSHKGLISKFQFESKSLNYGKR